MLEDRDYMRQPDYGSRGSVTIALLIVNAIVFLIQLAGTRTLHGAIIQDQYFALSLDGLKHGYVWQLLTFQFMHASWWHIILNSMAIFFFGRPVEMAFGNARFLTIYFISGIIGGLVQMLFALLLPSFNGAVVGASAGASGLVAAFAVLHWTERFTLFIYFFPVTMRGRTLLLASLALAVIGILTPNSGIANAAHLGGILTGFFFAQAILQGHWPQFKMPSFRSRRATYDADLPDDDEEVDRILEKIYAQGIQSLTKPERDALEKARAKMAKR
jgi:membrane associated rhomboid family serine protease